MDYFSWSLALKGKQPLEEILSLTILVLIVLAISTAPLNMLYERLMGGESFINLFRIATLYERHERAWRKGFCLTLVAGILFLKIVKTLQWKQRGKHGWDWRPRVKSLSCGVNLDVVKILNTHVYVWWSLLYVYVLKIKDWLTCEEGFSRTWLQCLGQSSFMSTCSRTSKI
jgi:hypothetical protein